MKPKSYGPAVEVPFQLRAALEVQRDLAAVSTLGSEVVWDVLGPDQAYILEKKLESMFPECKTVYTDKVEIRSANKYNAQRKQLRSQLFRSIWEQRKYTNGVLLHSIIYIVVTKELDIENAKFSHNYSLHPIFRTRRCLNSNSSFSCCMIFIDEQSRIYQNWNDFVNNNQLPIGTMVAPANGCYALNDNDEVQLMSQFTPAYHHQPLEVVDNVVSVVSVISQMASIIQPFFSILTIGTKTYDTIRDYQKQSDNEQHGTGTRASTLANLGGNIIGLTSSIATMSAQVAISKGESISFHTNVSLQVINGAATLISCTKLINTTYDIFTRYFSEDENLTLSDVVTFGSALILLTHSINNMAITSNLTDENGNKVRSFLKSTIRGSLKMIAGNAVRLGGGCGDLLRLANDIPYKDVLLEFFSGYNLTYSGFLSKVAVLGAIAVEIAPGIAVQIMDKEIVQVDFLQLQKYFGSKFVKHIANSANLIDILNAMSFHYSDVVIQFFMKQARRFLDTVADALDEKHNTFITTEIILFKMFSHAVKNYDNITYEFLNQKRDDIMNGVTQYFKSLYPRPADTNKDAQSSCDICGGYFSIAELS